MIIIAASPAAAIRVARTVGARAGYPSLSAAYDRLDGFPLPERLYVIEVPAHEYAAPSPVLPALAKASDQMRMAARGTAEQSARAFCLGAVDALAPSITFADIGYTGGATTPFSPRSTAASH